MADDAKPSDAQAARGGILSRFRKGLAKTRDVLGTPIGELALGGAERRETLRALETALVRADVGVELASSIVQGVGERAGSRADLTEPLREELIARVRIAEPASAAPEVRPRVIFLVGVNGTGKTTTLGKLAARSLAAGERPVLAACDTFRAAAIDQLAAWGERAGVPVVRQGPGADPAAVLHDALERARERDESPVFVDTAGRLHVKTHLMDELAKMSRVAGRLVEGAPHEAWLVLDATVGQNGLAQAREFAKATPLTGVVLTKLDGTARGGIAVAIASELQLPVRHVGVGEGIDDLVPFDAAAYVDGLLGN